MPGVPGPLADQIASRHPGTPTPGEEGQGSRTDGRQSSHRMSPAREGWGSGTLGALRAPRECGYTSGTHQNGSSRTTAYRHRGRERLVQGLLRDLPVLVGQLRITLPS